MIQVIQRTGPVSYTHLDVYKRQIQDGVIFHELRRGDESQQEFYGRILKVMAQLGGGSANAVSYTHLQRAFEKLNYREQTLLEKRLAICMTCGHVGSWKGRPTFEELAVMFEGSTASGAERAYRRAVDKLTELLVAEGAIHAVRLKQKSKTKRKKKIATAIYEYQADCDGEWGQISFDFENGTSEIVRLADWDTMKTNRFANKAIAYLLNCENEKLPKETIVAFEL